MSHTALTFSSLLRPDDEAFSSDEEDRIQLYRLMSLLGAFLISSLSILYRLSGLESASPMWAYLGLSGLFGGLFLLSYASWWIRRHYVPLMWGLMYLQMIWIAAVTTANDFRSEYGLALLLVYASIGVVIELGAQSLRPVLWFLGFGVLVTAGGLFLTSAPRLEPSVVLALMVVVALTVSLSLRGRMTIRQQRDLLDRLVETSPGVIVRLDHEGTFVEANGRVKEVLRNSEEDICGRTHEELEWTLTPFGEETMPKEEAPFDHVVETGESLCDAEFLIQWADGPQRVLSVSGAPLRTEGKSPEAVFHLRDITDRVRREQTLRRIKGRYQTLVNNFPDGGVFLFDEDLRFRLAGGQRLESAGLPPSKVEGKTPHDLFPDAIAREHVKYFRRALDGEKHVYEQEYEGQRYRVQTLPIRGDGGDVISGLAVSQDITERKERERRLRQSETLFQNAQDALFLLDVCEEADGRAFRYRRVNPVYESQFGHAEAEIRGRSPREVFGDDVGQFMMEKCRRCVRRREALLYEETIPLEGGETYWKTRIAPVVVEGDVRQIVGTARDVTEQHRRQETLERQNDLFDRAQEIASVGAWEYDVKRNEGNWTSKAYEILGFPPDADPNPRAAVNYYHPEDQSRVRAALQGALQEGQSSDLEVRVAAGDKVRWARIRGEPQWEDGEVARVRGTIQDITERKERERALREAKREAEEASQLKSSLLANMSHEIRTPLTSIIGFAEATNTEARGLDLPDDSPLPKYAELIEQSGRRLLETLEGVLNLSKLEAGEMELEARPVDLVQEAEAVAEELRPRAEEKGVSLHLETEAAWAEADEGGVQILARNLLSNAVKYTETGGCVWIRAHREEGAVAFEVEDTGIGMDPETAEGLFEPFRQASEGFAREYQGTGIGLAVTKETTRQMGGTIDVETEKGEGTRITVWLPRAHGGA
ncbi:PAS domain-containing sensor histidine kinase [Salinibacter altiplanensis]|uniref:PAS domain-containing sensor histidine kinase n=1 Tax=Salinibacter altiplanensis TaxID=1803181 RepID=UPI000C9F5AF1|nr:PAS domain-containing protein [Salinibacter altiplanensis]